MKPLGKENPGGWGVKLGKTLRGGGGGYGYFLELHNGEKCDYFQGHA